ncbi:MAG: UDP-N-acetylmuramate:L-alanyl-gamma-D-glutamyl-meso-diaminopimelate ligase [Sulfuricaulis sp.]
MRVHILGIGGAFMGGIALLARDLGHEVSGSDVKIYPPMSTQLEAQGIRLMEGYEPAHLDSTRPDLVIIGNALSRGNAQVEAVLNRNLRYISGAQWMAENILHDRWVLAVAGTHGKTTTASMLAWILEHAKLKPGFLIGGVPENFGVSARLGNAPFFVIEADEYDTAFFDKRSKFIHYRPRTAILNNLEYDHADIFPDLAAITLQFHYFVRTIPGSGLLVVNARDENLSSVLALGCWTPVEHFATADGWQAAARNHEASRFQIQFQGQDQGEIEWGLIGEHNMGNALAAVAAARHAGVPVKTAVAALAKFRNVKRRLEVRGAIRGITVYDDFAHHPTAIAATLQALRARVGNRRILAVLELRSNTMRMGVHRDKLAGALTLADRVLVLKPADLNWNLERVTGALAGRGQAFHTVEEIIDSLAKEVRPDDNVLIMSNGGFDNIHSRLLERLQA